MISIKKVLLVGTAAAATISLSVVPALADPPSGTTPRTGDIVGTGSDTTQLVVDQFASDYDKGKTPRKLYSFDAVGSATIQEKKGCDAARTRPVGSGAGIAELEANLSPSGSSSRFCVDFARSSRGRTGTDPTDIVFIPFALDGVTWAADNFAGKTNAPANLTTNKLRAIYSCDASLISSKYSGPVTWNEVGGTGKAKVVPVIPQSSSGTRAFFLKSIGVSTLGSCVQGQDNTVVENEGTNAIFKNKTTAPNIVFPYSVAVYLSQSQNGHGTGDQGKMLIRRVNKKAPTVGTAGKLTLNSSFPYLREVYNVVRNAGTASAPAVPSYLVNIFGNGAGKSGWICSKGAADIKSYGFLADPVCGTLE